MGLFKDISGFLAGEDVDLLGAGTSNALSQPRAIVPCPPPAPRFRFFIDWPYGDRPETVH